MFSIENLPDRLKAQTIADYRIGNYDRIVKVFLFHKIATCVTCCTVKNLIEWFPYWVQEGVFGDQPENITT